jgi:hypothetical protein
MAGALYALDRLVLDAGSRSTVGGLAVLAVEGALGVLMYLALLAVLAPKTAAELRDALARKRRGPIPTKGAESA